MNNNAINFFILASSGNINLLQTWVKPTRWSQKLRKEFRD